LDLTAGKMYVTNNGNSTISQANLDGTGGVSLGNLNGTLNGPWGIALDLTAGKMYVTNDGNSTISQANLDGTGGVSLGNLGGTLNNPGGIALDLTAGKMYVANFGNSTISQANLDGTGGVSLGNLNGTLNGPSGIALFDGTPACTSDADCDDGQFCNGTETCDIGTGNCVAVSACPPSIEGCVTRNNSCDEVNDVCVDFADDSQCLVGEICDINTGNCIPAAQAVTDVPTMSQWGMVIFLFLAGLVAIFYLRRRRTE
jgi:hypothetical protein